MSKHPNLDAVSSAAPARQDWVTSTEMSPPAPLLAVQDFCRQARFLIVDDQAANVHLLERLLTETGFLNFRSTKDSRLALALFEEYQPDMVLLDLMMPYLDGFAVMEQLRAVIAPDNYLPIVVLTADITSSVRRRALQAGARDFLTKPFDTAELHLRLRNLVEARFLHLSLQREKRGLEARVAERTGQLAETLEQLRTSQQKALQQERLYAFGTMAGGVVHDFNNSLMVLQGFSELLLITDALNDPVQARHDVELIHRAAGDAAQVVRRLRQFYRPTTVEDEFAPVEVGALLASTGELAQPKWCHEARSQGGEVKLAIDSPPNLQVSGNESELREALMNLSFNAVDAMPAGGTLTLAAREMEDDQICLEVRDTGGGMDAETQARCLEPFFTTKGTQGTGLGLAMVFGIVRRHHGTIEIDSELGRGTAIRLLLPRALKGTPPRAAVERAPRRPLRVLFAEDDPSVRELLREFLHLGGHTVTEACDGVEALSQYEPRRFDVILTDLSMPRMNGLVLAEEIKRRDPRQSIVMVTGFAETLLPREHPTAHLDALLTKPISANALLEALDRATQYPDKTEPRGLKCGRNATSHRV